MSLINFSMLVHAINVYLNDNYPEAPEDFNFQAELKAASHWHWSDWKVKDGCLFDRLDRGAHPHPRAGPSCYGHCTKRKLPQSNKSSRTIFEKYSPKQTGTINLQPSTMKLNYNICNLAGKISQMASMVTGLILNKVLCSESFIT
ncbi:uncharacterized protein [Porites lutea]|uniref:uncharacterized protein n=1 Tax=Porites lutea TaxID=51062 RepID=UPI003CC5F2EB